MLGKIFVGVVAMGLLGAGGYLYYQANPCDSCCNNNSDKTPSNAGTLPVWSCPSEEPGTSTDELPMPREVVAQ